MRAFFPTDSPAGKSRAKTVKAPCRGLLFFTPGEAGKENMALDLHQAAQWCLSNFILIMGFAGQALFSARFLVQWIASEKEGKSVVPLPFWYLSVGGGGLLFAYAIFRKDPVFILGQGGGLLIYVRNLYLIHKERLKRRAEPNISD